MPAPRQATDPANHYQEWAKSARADNPPASMEEYIHDLEAFFDHYAIAVDIWRNRNSGYHRSLASLARFYIPENASVLELGSGSGELLAAVSPQRGVGIDISQQMVDLAAQKFPALDFRQMSAEHLNLEGQQFDYIILSDLTGFLFDIRLVFERLRAVCHAQTRIVLHWYSRIWQPLLIAAEKLGLKYPQPLLNWTTVEDIRNFFYLTDFEVVQHRQHILIPKQVPVLSHFANRYLAHLPVIRHLCLTNWMVARPQRLFDSVTVPSVSVICPCRNEAGNIQSIVDRLPGMGSYTELIFVEGHSKDETLAACHKAVAANPEKDITVMVQPGRGKGDAVRMGFAQAKGDIVMILDADISVVPEDLVHFYDALASGKAEFVNGSRLVYTMDPEAMRFLNLLANWFFALLLSALMGQPIKDSLCGTKVMWRTKYEELAHGRNYFGAIDPFGDFDLLFGAAKLNLKIVEIPVRYRQRVYGSTNINRFRDGMLLLRMSARAAAKLYFVA